MIPEEVLCSGYIKLVLEEVNAIYVSRLESIRYFFKYIMIQQWIAIGLLIILIIYVGRRR